MTGRPSDIVVVGLSHHTAPVDVRERLSVATDALASRVVGLVSELPIDEAVLVSTCNRVEIYGVSTSPGEALGGARAYLKSRAQPDAIDPFLYEHHGMRAVHHAFRVTSSLDSMVIGEPQILGQVKDAVRTAETAGTLGPLLRQCFHQAFQLAKRVRTETQIAAGTVSVSSIAVDLALQIFGSLDQRRVLLVGAGKMGETAARGLGKRGAAITVVNRSPDRAKALAEAAGGRALPYEQLLDAVGEADVVITSTGSPTFILGPEAIRQVMRSRKGRPLFVIDIAVPRDVDPKVGDIDNVFLYDVDDLQKVASENLASRRKEAERAEGIVRTEVDRFEKWRASLSLTPTIVGLRGHFERIARAEVERSLGKMRHLSDDDRRALEETVGRVVQKLLHQPLTALKREGSTHEAHALTDAVRRLYDLDAAPSLPPERRESEDAERAPDAALHAPLQGAPSGGTKKP